MREEWTNFSYKTRVVCSHVRPWKLELTGQFRKERDPKDANLNDGDLRMGRSFYSLTPLCGNSGDFCGLNTFVQRTDVRVTLQF